MNDQHERDAAGDGQQGTGGVSSGQATSTPDQRGRQPHLGSHPSADSAPGGTGQSSNSEGIASVEAVDAAGGSVPGPHDRKHAAPVDRLDTIEQADDRAGQSARERERDIGAQTPGDPGDLLSQPLGDGNYQKRGDTMTPLVDGGGESGSQP